MRFQTRISLKPGESAIFGYGSLISTPSLERTLRRPYQGPLIVCNLENWRRVWNIAMANKTYYAMTPRGRLYPHHIIYLNISRHSVSRLNGVLFVVTEKELKALDQRESIYNRIVITDQLQNITVDGGDAYTYVGKPEYIIENVKSPNVAAVRATYLEIIERGFKQLGSRFRKAFETSSDPVPKHLIISDSRDDLAPDPFHGRN